MKMSWITFKIDINKKWKRDKNEVYLSQTSQSNGINITRFKQKICHLNQLHIVGVLNAIFKPNCLKDGATAQLCRFLVSIIAI